jgi:hypothetical protein
MRHRTAIGERPQPMSRGASLAVLARKLLGGFGAMLMSRFAALQMSRSQTVMELLYLQNHLDLDRSVTRERRHTDGRSGVFANRFSEHLDHQIGKCVDCLRPVAKAPSRVDHPENLHDAPYPIKAAEFTAWANAARGETTSPLPMRAMKSRRLIRSPRRRGQGVKVGS